MSVTPARKSAFDTVVRVFEDDAYADRAFRSAAEGLDARDRALAQRLAYGTVQRVRTLDHGRGLICLCLTEERCDELRLRPMTERNETPFGTAFTISIEAREGISTGISAQDRSRTIQVAIDPHRRT